MGLWLAQHTDWHLPASSMHAPYSSLQRAWLWAPSSQLIQPAGTPTVCCGAATPFGRVPCPVPLPLPGRSLSGASMLPPSAGLGVGRVGSDCPTSARDSGNVPPWNVFIRTFADMPVRMNTNAQFCIRYTRPTCAWGSPPPNTISQVSRPPCARRTCPVASTQITAPPTPPHPPYPLLVRPRPLSLLSSSLLFPRRATRAPMPRLRLVHLPSSTLPPPT